MDGDTLIFVDNNKNFLYNISNKEIYKEVTDMRYDRETLEKYAKKLEIVGLYGGEKIYACTKKDYETLHVLRPDYFIIYDDYNKLVKQNRIEGQVTVLGSINDVNKQGEMYIVPKKKESVPVKFYATTSDKLKEEVKVEEKKTEDFFDKVDKMIDDILSAGFNYDV